MKFIRQFLIILAISLVGEILKYILPLPIPASIYLMNHVDAPAVLGECGFLSNREETARLQQEDYQKTLAAVIAAGYLRWMAGEDRK